MLRPPVGGQGPQQPAARAGAQTLTPLADPRVLAEPMPAERRAGLERMLGEAPRAERTPAAALPAPMLAERRAELERMLAEALLAERMPVVELPTPAEALPVGRTPVAELPMPAEALAHGV
ncbi:MAG: hypothetical protein WA463_12345 [Terriglobales bacterium]